MQYTIPTSVSGICLPPNSSGLRAWGVFDLPSGQMRSGAGGGVLEGSTLNLREDIRKTTAPSIALTKSIFGGQNRQTRDRGEGIPGGSTLYLYEGILQDHRPRLTLAKRNFEKFGAKSGEIGSPGIREEDLPPEIGKTERGRGGYPGGTPNLQEGVVQDHSSQSHSRKNQIPGEKKTPGGEKSPLCVSGRRYFLKDLLL